MIISRSRAGVRIVAVPVLVIDGVGIRGEVRVGSLQSVIDNPDPNPVATPGVGGKRSSRVVPDGLDVHVGSAECAALVVEFEVPLIVDQGVIRHRPLRLLSGEKDIHGGHICQSAPGIETGQSRERR